MTLSIAFLSCLYAFKFDKIYSRNISHKESETRNKKQTAVTAFCCHAQINLLIIKAVTKM